MVGGKLPGTPAEGAAGDIRISRAVSGDMAKAGCDIGGENAPNTRENCPKRYFGDGFETLK